MHRKQHVIMCRQDSPNFPTQVLTHNTACDLKVHFFIMKVTDFVS